EAGGWDESWNCCQERELLLRLATAGAQFLLLNQPGAVYRFHGEHTVSRKDPSIVIRRRLEITDRFEQFLKHERKLNSDCQGALAEARMECARRLYGDSSAEAKELYARVRRDVGRW